MKAHRQSNTVEYRIWCHMKDRCENASSRSYANYGARGIVVCDRWQQFENFIADMGLRPSPAHSIERKNNALGYSPENCMWATIWHQARNRRSNINVTLNGRTMCLKDWCVELRRPYKRTLQRITILGWTPESAITDAVKHKNQYH